MGASDGLMAELRGKRSDGTPRGLRWDLMADVILIAAPCASTPEEVEMANAALAAILQAADGAALQQLEFQLLLAQLRAVLPDGGVDA